MSINAGNAGVLHFAQPFWVLWGDAGQSNVGRGNPTDTTRFDLVHPRVFQLGNPGSAPAGYGNVISAAIEPLYHADPTDATHGVGHAAHAAKRLLHILPPNARILIIPAGYGGTAMHTTTRSWDPAKLPGDTTNLAAAFVAQWNIGWGLCEAEYPGTTQALGMAFQQGEADAGSLTQAQYAAAIDRLDAYVRANAIGFGTAPIVLGGMVPEWIPTTTGADLIRLAQIDTPSRKVNTAYVDGIAGDPNGTPPSIIHYGPIAQRKLGTEYAKALLRARANVTGKPPVAPGVPVLTQSGFNVLAKWTMPQCRVTDFLIEYKINAGAWTTLSHTASLDNNATITGGAATDTVQVRLSTVNAAGTSSATTPASITLVALPAALSGLTVGTVTSSAVGLSWSASARATSYLIEKELHSGGSYATFATVTGLSVNVSGLPAATAHDFRVTPQNAAGNGTAGTISNQSTNAASTLINDIGVSADENWGLERLVTGYAGHAITVRRASDSTTLDIDFLTNGDLDVASMETFCAGTNGFVSKVWDQSGNLHHLTQATTTKQPQIVIGGATIRVGGQPAMQFVSGNYFDVSVITAYAAGACTFMAVAFANTVPTAMTLFAESKSGGNGRYQMFVGTADVLGSIIRDDANTNALNTTGTLAISADGAHVAHYTDTGSSYQSGVDGVFNSAVSYTRSGHTLTLTLAAVGALPGASYTLFYVGFLSQLSRWNSALTAPQIAAGVGNLKSYYSIP